MGWRSQTLYTTLCNGIVSHGAPFGGIQVLPTTHTDTNTNKMRPRSSRTMRHVMRVYLFAQTTVNMHLIWQIMLILIVGKTQIPPAWATCQDENGTRSGISIVDLCIVFTFYKISNITQDLPFHSMIQMSQCLHPLTDHIVLLPTEKVNHCVFNVNLFASFCSSPLRSTFPQRN